MNLIYNIAISLYNRGIKLASLFNNKAFLLNEGRKHTHNFCKDFKRDKQKLIWLHAASLGEFEQGRPIMEALKAKEPNTKILLTFFSPSGYEVSKNYSSADYILYLPSDSPRKAKQFVSCFNPDIAIFVKYEFWYNFLNQLHKKNIPTYLISANFQANQVFFKPWGGLYRKMLHFFNKLFVQNAESVRLLKKIGITNVEKVGDTRFDRVKQISKEAKRLTKIEDFLKDSPSVVCGSSWPPDEDILFSYINNSQSKYKWIIAPHQIDEGHIKSIISKCKRKVSRYSQENCNGDVLIIDCIGILSSIYRYGNIAYIGGGFGVGIHNTVEAAVYGMPVIFGPKYQRFKEAIDLIEIKGGFSIDNEESLHQLLDKFITNEDYLNTCGKNALKYVDSQLGSSDAILKHI